MLRRVVAGIALVSSLATHAAAEESGQKLKITGYLQARWETGERSTDSVAVTSSGTSAANLERFYMRRARLKATYDASPTSRGVVYLDAGADREVLLLEAYLTLIEPWTGERMHRLTFGQMTVPFGFEVEQSSSARELPERSFAENRLFRGERDRGVTVESRWSPRFETTFGIFNGGGIKDAEFPDLDPTAKKDWLARARVTTPHVDGGVSWYQGKGVLPLTGPDVEVDRTRFGADVQARYEAASLGRGTLRGELYVGRNANPDSSKALVTATGGGGRVLAPGADPEHLATDVLGWYVMWVQDVHERWQLVGRWDAWDPDTDVDHDQFDRLTLGVNHFWDAHTRIGVSYDIPMTDGPSPGYDDPKDNLWTVQLQHKF